MKKYFTYSILQYKHSITLGEILNVGILFHFHDENRFELSYGGYSRLKSIYPDFDIQFFNGFLKVINEKIGSHINLFSGEGYKTDFIKYIHQNILKPDVSGLVFAEPVSIENVFESNKSAVDFFSKQFLPGIIIEKPKIISKHDDKYIFKQFSGYVFNQHKELENRVSKNEIIQTDKVKVKFDLSWSNKKHRRYVKPISFDLSNEQAIQEKAITHFGYLTQLIEYTKKHDIQFDFLLAKPQNRALKSAFENALDILDSVPTAKRLVRENELKVYSEETLEELLSL